MKRFKPVLLIVIFYGILFLLCFLGSCSKKADPIKQPVKADTTVIITSLSVTSGPYNTVVVISGANFNTNIAKDQVYFNGKQAAITAATTTQITTTVPLGAGTGQVTVSVNSSIPVYGPTFTYQLSGVLSVIVGSTQSGVADGSGSAVLFDGPSSLCVVGSAGNRSLFTSEPVPGLVRRTGSVAHTTVSIAGYYALNTALNGEYDASPLQNPQVVAVDSMQGVYIANNGGQTIIKVNYFNNYSTIAQGNSFLANIFGLTVDVNYNIYLSNKVTNTIEKILSGKSLIAFAGSGVSGNTNGTGGAASFNAPMGLAADPSGNVYVADSGNKLIRKITPAGVVSTFAGSGQAGTTDGQGTSASFTNPLWLASDEQGNIFVIDNSTSIRKIDQSGNVTTLLISSKVTNLNAITVGNDGTIYVVSGNEICQVVFE